MPKRRFSALFLFGIFALMVIGSLSVPTSGNEVSYSYDPIELVKNFQVAAVVVENSYSSGVSKKTTTSDLTGVTVGSGECMYIFLQHSQKTGGGGKYALNVVWDTAGVGEAFEKVGAGQTQQDKAVSELWRLLTPTAKSATITVTWDTNNANWNGAVLGVYCLSGVDVGGTPDDGYQGMNRADMDVLWIEIDTTVGDTTLGGAILAGAVTLTEDGDGTSAWDISSDVMAGSSSYFTADDSIANHTWSSSALGDWAASGVSINGLGGIPYSKDLIETVSAVDVQTNAADFDRSYTESVSSVDVITNAANFVRNLVETIGVLGILSIAKVTTKDMVETISASDVLTNTGSFVRDLTESVSAVDAIAKAVGINMTEAITAADTIEVYKAVVKDMVETITVSYVTTKDVGKNMIESISAIDAQSNAAVYVRDFIEAITAADVQTNAADFARNLVETITVVEIIDAYIVGGPITKNLSENITVSDVLGTEGGTPVTYSLFYELFFSLDMWGYLGPIGLVIGGYIVVNKEKILGVLWFVVEALFISHYLTLVEATPDYWWHIVILLFGGMLTIAYASWDR